MTCTTSQKRVLDALGAMRESARAMAASSNRMPKLRHSAGNPGSTGLLVLFHGVNDEYRERRISKASWVHRTRSDK
jgi:hypothetical protein